MKKTFWSLAALTLLAAPMITSCGKDLDQEQTKDNIVTLTIAPPVNEAGTRVAVDNSTLKITGWELNDEVILYNASIDYEMSESSISGDGVTFKCINAANGTFSGTLPEGKTLADYNLAVFGATATNKDYKIHLIPTTKCSSALKDVVMMAALKSGDSYTMQVINCVMKLNNNTGSAMEVSWCGYTGSGSGYYFFTPQIKIEDGNWYGVDVYDGGWADSHFTLPSGVCFINMGLQGHPEDRWGIAKESGMTTSDGKKVGGRSYGGAIGKILNGGTIN